MFKSFDVFVWLMIDAVFLGTTEMYLKGGACLSGLFACHLTSFVGLEATLLKFKDAISYNLNTRF